MFFTIGNSSSEIVNSCTGRFTLYVRFEPSKAVRMNVLWEMMACKLVHVY